MGVGAARDKEPGGWHEIIIITGKRGLLPRRQRISLASRHVGSPTDCAEIHHPALSNLRTAKALHGKDTAEIRLKHLGKSALEHNCDS